MKEKRPEDQAAAVQGTADKVQSISTAEDKVSGQQTAATAVINALKRAKAMDEQSAVGYDALKDIKLTTPVLAYTLANLLKENVIYRTEDERYYFSKEGWKKLERKVYVGYGILFIVPVIMVFLFLLLRKYF